MFFLRWVLFPLLNVLLAIFEKLLSRGNEPPIAIQDFAVAGALLKNALFSLVLFELQALVQLESLANAESDALAHRDIPLLTSLVTTSKGLFDKLNKSIVPIVVIAAVLIGYFLLRSRYEALPIWLILSTVMIGLMALITVPYLFFA